MELITELAADGSLSALRPLVARPRAVAQLDREIRRFTHWNAADLPEVAAAGSEITGPSPRPVAVAIAASHPNGHLRQRAVELIASAPAPELMPQLVLRTADWVPQVRARAREALVDLLDRDPVRYGPAVAPMALLLAVRERGPFARRQLLGALHDRGDRRLLDALLASEAPAVRRFATTEGAAVLPVRELLALALRSGTVPEAVVAADLAARAAVWTGQADQLRRLAGSPRQAVRATGLTGLLRLGGTAEVAGHLLDDAPLVRALAREAARRGGIDAVARYRTEVTAELDRLRKNRTDVGALAAGAVDGLAETGGRADVALLTGLLQHPAGAVRAAAVRGLRALGGGAEAAHLVPLLRDRSARVVREATRALRPHAAVLPAGLARGLLAGGRTVERRAGYALLVEPDPAELLAVRLAAAADPDPRLARTAANQAIRQIRELRRRVSPADGLAADRRAGLVRLAERAAGLIGEAQVAAVRELVGPVDGSTPAARP